MFRRFLLSTLRPKSLRPLVFRQVHEENKIVVFDAFSKAAVKNKNTYMAMIKIFEDNDIRRRGHVEFIYAALKHMQEFGVQKDLEVYKTLLEVLPKGRFVPTNFMQAEFMHFPKQQQCAIDVLEQMEDNGVMPDFEMEDILLNIFGKRGFPLRKFWRMMYWMPKFRNLSPWRLPQNLPMDSLELAKIAIERITSVDNDMKISVFYTDEVDDAIDHTWIVSAQSPMQKALIANELKFHTEHPKEGEPLVVRGSYTVRLREQVVTYFILTSTYRENIIPEGNLDDVSKLSVPNIIGSPNLPAMKQSVHEQDDGNILAVCATGTSSRDSLLSWIRLLEKNDNSGLASLPVIFTLTSPTGDIVPSVTQPAAT